jgi:hypothetical protein
MNKVSAQQIRSLEIRIARLEREAGVVDGFLRSVKRLGNIPRNIITRIGNALADLGTTALYPVALANTKAMKERLGYALAIRIQGVVTAGYFPIGDSLVLEEFNIKNPIKSIFRKGGETVLPLDKMINLTYLGGEQKRLKAAYLSWKSDYGDLAKDIVDVESGNIGELGSNENFLKVLKRTSKMLYRLFKAFLDLAPAVATVVLSSTGWAAYKVVFSLMFSKHRRTLSKIEEGLKGMGHLNDIQGFYGGITAGGAAMASLLLNLIERAFYRYGVNVDAFDTESAGRTASSHPRVASVIRLLESHA